MSNDLKIVLKGEEAQHYILLRNEINALAVQAKAVAKKLHLAVARLDSITKP